MTRHWRSLGFVPLALLLVLLVHDLSVKNRPATLNQVGKSTVAQASTKSPPMKVAERLLAGPVTEIPLYESGDLPARKPIRKKVIKRRSVQKMKLSPIKPALRQKARPTPRQKPAPMKATAADPAPDTIPEGREEAVQPVLVASYDQIGFARYLEVIEKVGRFFILLRHEGGTKIGPPVSLARRATLRRNRRPTAGLAMERPHLVSDHDVRRRLQEMRLPTNAYPDRVALLFNVGFDRALWFAVGNALRQKKLALHQVEEVKGHYVLRSGGIYLEFDSALLKEDGVYVPLSDAIKVTL